ncbi:hypothetical protein L6164_029599 [Bauhinia variegata]|uniref:Uncharacterized protein n=1 Tax=Bauhinia variegata TaxID=167791 RepID=A0ACB9LA82_BAUVA|nr:hypothetical protein L6164_029599 [Bauhinia variegata]
MSGTASLGYGGPALFNAQQQQQQKQLILQQASSNKLLVGKHKTLMVGLRGKMAEGVRCSGIGIGDFIGGDLVKFDLGQWLSDFEEHKALAIYSPHLLVSDTKAHVGKQPIARWYFPPEVDYRLEALPPNAKGLLVWIIEAKVLSKAELQFLALLPTLRPKVRVIAECGNWRKLVWKPLKEIAGLTEET